MATLDMLFLITLSWRVKFPLQILISLFLCAANLMADELPPVQIYENDDRWKELQAAHEQWKIDDRRMWEEHYFEQLKARKEWNYRVAPFIIAMSDAEKAELLEWLNENPLKRERHVLLVRALVGDQEAEAQLKEFLSGPIPDRSTDLERLRDYNSCMITLCSLPSPYFDWAKDLTIAQLDAPDRILVMNAMNRLKYIREREVWFDAAKQQIINPEFQGRARLLELCKYGEPIDLGTLEKAWALREPDERTQPYISAINNLIRQAPADVSVQAENVLASWQGSLPSAREINDATVNEILSGKANPTSRSVDVFVTWAEVEPEKRVPELVGMLGDPRLSRVAREALLILKWGSGDGELAQQIYEAELDPNRAIGRKQWYRGLFRSYQDEPFEPDYRIGYGILNFGGAQAKAITSEAMDEIKYGKKSLGWKWAKMGISTEDVLLASVDYGIIESMPPREVIIEGVKTFGPKNDPFHTWISIMNHAGVMTYFDSETGMFPNRHDELILNQMKAASHGKFEPIRAIEVWNEQQDGYHVLFEESGKWYEFFARNRGDWYDVEAVTEAVNVALQEKGVEERFIPVSNSGQAGTLLLTTEAKLKPFAEKYGIRYGDPDQGRKQGQAFEEAVKARLGLEESGPLQAH